MQSMSERTRSDIKAWLIVVVCLALLNLGVISLGITVWAVWASRQEQEPAVLSLQAEVVKEEILAPPAPAAVVQRPAVYTEEEFKAKFQGKSRQFIRSTLGRPDSWISNEGDVGFDYAEYWTYTSVVVEAKTEVKKRVVVEIMYDRVDHVFSVTRISFHPLP